MNNWEIKWTEANVFLFESEEIRFVYDKITVSSKLIFPFDLFPDILSNV